MKLCSKCGLHPRAVYKSGPSSWCAPCMNEKSKNRQHSLDPAVRRKYWNSKHKCLYGISLDDKLKIFKKQGRCCAICGSREHGGNGWCSDHSHLTGKFRGVLCVKCNILLGAAQDSIRILNQSIQYLLKYQGDDQ